jgi:hypothetical protein
MPWRLAAAQPGPTGPAAPAGIRLLGRAEQFTYLTNLGGLSLRHEATVEPNGTAILRLTIAKGTAAWLSVSASHPIVRPPGRVPVQVSLSYGPPFNGIRAASFTIDAGGMVQGAIDGRAIVPLPVTSNPANLRFQDGRPPAPVSLAPGAEQLIKALLRKAAVEGPAFIRGSPPPRFRSGPSPANPSTTGGGHESHPGLSASCIAALAGCQGIELGCMFGASAGCAFLLFGAAFCIAAAIAVCVIAFAACVAVALQSPPFCCPVSCGPGTGGTDNGCCDQSETCLDASAPNGLCCSPGLRPCNNRSCCQPGDTCMPDGSCCPQGLNTCATGGGLVCCDRGQVCQPPGVCCPSNQVVCAGVCCTPDIHACNGGICCPQSQAACNGVCCPPGGGCDSNGNCCFPPSHLCGGFCCPPFNQCCNNQCCGSDELCVNNQTCCPRNRVCGSRCCPPGQRCQNGNCVQCSAGTVPCATFTSAGVPITICCPPGAECCLGVCCTSQTGNQCTGPGGSCGFIH